MNLTVKEVAELKGCSIRYIQSQIKAGKIIATEAENPANNRKEYHIKVKNLPEDLQAKYYAKINKELPATLKNEHKTCKKQVEEKRIDEYSKAEREEIELWCSILSRWQEHRAIYESKLEADKDIIGAINMELRMRGLDLRVNSQKLYRKYYYYKNGLLGGLIDERGGWNRGQSSIPEQVWDGFLYYYLDERRPSLSTVYRNTIDWTKEFYPELVEVIPSERSFRRHLQTDVPKAIVTLFRKGQKALDDSCLYYIERLYDDLEVNDCWVTDNHTLDIQTKKEDGTDTIHRLYLTAFLDAKSGIITGWNITDNPSINSTLFALRMGILKYGKPRMILSDNGSEFSSYDFNNRGNRRKKEENMFREEQTILGRLNIELRLAKVKNARAKHIERFFLSFKEHISKLFSSYTGGNIMERPESLKRIIRNGEIPTDSKLRETVGELIELENNALYGGAEQKRYKGFTKIEVWNDSVKRIKQIFMTENDLTLCLMRAKNYQKVKRNGVYITIAGEQLWYNSEDTWLHQDEQVLVRYNPLDLSSVRLYDKDDRYLFTWELERTLLLSFMDADIDKISEANEKLAKQRKVVKQYGKDMFVNMKSETKIDMLDLMVKRAHIAKEGSIIEQSSVIELQQLNETEANPLLKTGTDNNIVDIDIARMNRNIEERKKR